MITCNKCGRDLPEIEVNVFDYEGSDHWVSYPLYPCSNEAAYVDLSHAWTGDDLTEDEQLETIRCPHCKQYPFDDQELQVYSQLRVVMFDKKDHPGECDIPVEWIRNQIKNHAGMHAASWARLLELWETETKKC